MKKNILIAIALMLFVQYYNHLFAQADYNLNIQINDEYSQNTILNPFNGEIVTALSISGEVVFNSDKSFVRIIVNDSDGNEYLIYESYPMLSENNQFELDYECEESCFFDDYQPNTIEVQIQDASIQIDEINYSNINYSDAEYLRKQAKYSKNATKLSAVQNYIVDHNLIWVAEETDFSRLSYKDKAKFWGKDYRSFGFEFYSLGYYSITGPTDSDHTQNYGFVGNFDWRNRHGANQSNSPYYDGDENGTGWMTPVVCQGLGCWLDGEFICNMSESECIAEGGDFRTAGTCWIFGPTAYIEALTNLYYNEHIDVDLSEQFIACEENNVDPGNPYKSFLHFKNTGVPDENCLPYSASLENCDDLCSNPYEEIRIQGYTGFVPSSHIVTRQTVMDYGPVEAHFMNGPWGPQSHSMSLVGWGVVDEDELSIMGVTNPITSDWYGHTYWIYKESKGSSYHHNGFRYMIHWEGEEPGVIKATLPIYSLNRTDADINCYDKDSDGYYFWGIGPKPAHCPPCPDEPDGDDSNPGLGPLTDNGTCKIINTYNASFEEDWDNWIQIDSDDQDWWRHTGPTPTYAGSTPPGITGPAEAQDGDYYIYTEASCNGCYSLKDFTIESPTIELNNYCKTFIDFYYNMNIYFWGNPDDARLELQISYDNGVTWEPNYWSVVHDQGEEWHHINLGLPVNVTKVRFIATTSYTEYSDIALDNITIGPVHQNETPITISNPNTIWNTDDEIYSNIVIENGADLTINNSTILMHDETNIIVQPGGKLILNNSTINTMCEQNKWAGIQVWGDINNTQTEEYQGKLEMYNSTISNAHEAVQLWKPGDYSKTGGMIYAENSTFLNNRRAISFLSFENLHPVFGIESDYSATFERCTFENDENYLDDNPFHTFVSMWDVRGVKFKACEFNSGGKGESAIYTLDAGYKVESICNGAIGPDGCLPQHLERNEFYGFDKAICSQNSLAADMYPINIQHAYFYNNNYGCYFSGLQNVLNVKTSLFYIGNNGETKEKAICGSFSGRGIHIQFSTGFFIENNEFNKMPEANASDEITGIVAISNPSDHDIIYKNKFNDLKRGNKAVNNNREDNDIFGIEYQCNENYNNTYTDFEITGISLDAKINPDLGHANLSARNIFSTNVQWHWRNMGQEIEYYHLASNELGTIYEPLDSKIETYLPNTFVKMNTSEINECPDDDGIHIERITLTPEEQTDLELEFAIASNEYDAVEQIYNDLKDGGNTEGTTLTIDAAQPGDTWELRGNLLGKSPYLSREVLEKAANKTDVLPNSVLLDILAANPDELKKADFINFLENKEEPLPNYMIDILRELSTGTTYKTALLNQLALQKRKQTISAKQIINSLINEDEQDYSAIKSWLGSMQNIVSDLQVASILIKEGNYTDANALLNLIPDLYNLDAEELSLYQDDKYLLDMKTTLQQENRNITQLNEDEIAELEIIADNTKGMARASARTILESFYGYDNYCDCIEENENKSSNTSFADNNNINETPLNIYATPNPAKHFVEFHYELSEIDVEAIIIITDINGKQIQLFNIDQTKGIQTWDTRKIPSGSYIYTLKTKYFEESGKLIIQ